MNVWLILFLLLTSINSLTKGPLHNVTRGIFHNTWGGSHWPFHLQIPPGALNMTTNSRVSPLICYPNSAWIQLTQVALTSTCILHNLSWKLFIKRPHFSFKNHRNLVGYLTFSRSFGLKLNVCRTWPPSFVSCWRGSSFNICTGC